MTGKPDFEKTPPGGGDSLIAAILIPLLLIGAATCAFILGEVSR